MPRYLKGHRAPTDHNERAFTLIELVLVITIMGLMIGIFSVRLSDVNFWKEEAALRKLTELVIYLNNEAVMNQAFYRLEFDLENRQYRVGAIKNDSNIMQNQSGANIPPLQLELSAMLSPDMGDESTLVPPPGNLSLAEPITLPGQMEFLDVMTPRGKVATGDKRDNPYLIFSPRGTSEFGVIHVALGPEHPVTILVNPWTGMAEVYREYKDFKWNLSR
jgi:prepilin-type N-terminal cleavage/methylation domain-containing protein